MLDLLYYILIFPLESAMGLILDLSHQLTKNYGVSIILLSVIVNIALLPLYYLAQKWKAKDEALQGLMKKEIKNIKKYYKGQERHYYIQAIYRRYGYHPLSSVKASVGFLIQIPFFFAAFHLLSNYAPLNGVGFWFLKDLGSPDLLLDGVNVLPILMTIVNLLSAYVYMELLSKAEKIQLWALAFIFLVALYNEASGLLLYWTMSNVFSLFKNLIEKKLKLGPLFAQKLNKLKHKKQKKQSKISDFLHKIYPKFKISFWLAALIFGIALDRWYVYFTNQYNTTGLIAMYETIALFIFLDLVLILDYIINEKNKNLSFRIFFGLVFVLFVLLFIDLLTRIFEFTPADVQRDNVIYIVASTFIIFAVNKALKLIKPLNNFNPSFVLFALIFATLSFLVFVINPIMLYNGAIDDFSIGSNLLLSKIFMVFVVAVLIASAIYFISSKVLKNALIFVGSFLLLSSLLYSFVIIKDYGLLDHFIFHTPQALLVTKTQAIFEVFSLIAFAIISSIALFKYPKILKQVYGVVLVMLVSYFLLNIPHKETKEQTAFDLEKEQQTTLNFSKEKNVLVLFLDGFSGGDMQRIVNEKRHIFNDYNGFTWYKNTLTTGTATWSSIAAMFGGHEFTAENINKKIKSVTKKNPQEQLYGAFNMFPKAFGDYQISYLLEPVYDMELSGVIFGSLLDYGEYYLASHDHQLSHSLKNELEFKMLNVISIFRASPIFMKRVIYRNGTWGGVYTNLLKETESMASKAGSWGFLNILVKFARLDNPQRTLKYIQLSIPHNPNIMAADGNLSVEKSSYYIEAYKSLEKIGELLRKFKKQKIYDETKIIIVSDHGWWRKNQNFPTNFNVKISKGYQGRMNTGMIQPLLLVKDFNQTNDFKISNRFMSNADVPSIVCSALKNGCDIKDLDPTKHNLQRSLTISTTEVDFKRDKKYDIKDQYKVKDNIFDPDNWKKIK